jgi:phage terminase large subunit-like protein
LLALQPETTREAILNEYSDAQLNALLYDWEFWARPSQLAPEGDWFCWLLLAGRGFGKTRTATEWACAWAKEHPGQHLALIGETKADVRDVLVEKGESSILEISPPWFMPDYESSKRRVTWPNGAYATLYSGDEPDQLRGPQHAAAVVDELAKYKHPQATWDNLEFGLRAGDRPQVVVATTPRPIPIIKALLKDPDVTATRGSSYENIHNLAAAFIKRVIRRYEGTHLGRQELHAELLEDDPRALWQREEMIDAHRVMVAPDLVRVVVGVDPPGGATECGIVAAGLGVDGDAYVLEDRSLQASPDKWGQEVVTCYHGNKAGRVLGESNFGGDMVESIIRTIDPTISYRAVHASRGKAVRAEPVSALYEQGRAHHVGQLSGLEDEQCSWVPGETKSSPNRIDALVWTLTELMLGDMGEASSASVNVDPAAYRTQRKSRLWTQTR